MAFPRLPSRHGSVPAQVREGDVEALLPAAVVAAGVRRVCLVTDAGVAATGWPARVVRVLRAVGCEVQVFADVLGEPTEAGVAACADAVGALRPEALVAVGGGSVLDTAKAIAWLLANPGPMGAYRGWRPDVAPLIPLFAVPTTAGTGSEVQSFALIARDGDHVKMACGTSSAMPRLAVLDARTTASSPPLVTARAGMDALVHALETSVTTARTEQSTAHAERAFGLLVDHLPGLVDAPTDLTHRAGVLRGACMAGQAIEASMLGATHAAANPLSAQYGVAHGSAVGLMAPHVVRLNAADPASASTYARLGARAGCGGDAASLASFLDDLLSRFGLPRRLGADLGVPRDGVDALVADALTQWTGTFNPVPVDADAFRDLYAAAGV